MLKRSELFLYCVLFSSSIHASEKELKSSKAETEADIKSDKEHESSLLLLKSPSFMLKSSLNTQKESLCIYFASGGTEKDPFPSEMHVSSGSKSHRFQIDKRFTLTPQVTSFSDNGFFEQLAKNTSVENIEEGQERYPILWTLAAKLASDRSFYVPHLVSLFKKTEKKELTKEDQLILQTLKEKVAQQFAEKNIPIENYDPNAGEKGALMHQLFLANRGKLKPFGKL